jgi:hypothetical protein
VTSLVYATYTLIFLAYEGAIMAQALTALTHLDIHVSRVNGLAAGSWDADVVDELGFGPDDLVIDKARFGDYAMAAAEASDEELASGVDRGPLHGIPCGVKDILAMAEGPTTAQSLILDRTWGEGRDAPVVARLKQAGAVITGKTTSAPRPIRPSAPRSRRPWRCWPARAPTCARPGCPTGPRWSRPTSPPCQPRPWPTTAATCATAGATTSPPRAPSSSRAR